MNLKQTIEQELANYPKEARKVKDYRWHFIRGFRRARILFSLEKAGITEYPKTDGKRKIYMHYPVKFDNAWEAVEVKLDGGYSRIPTAIALTSESDCKRGCDTHNSWAGFSKEQQQVIMEISMAESLSK